MPDKVFCPSCEKEVDASGEEMFTECKNCGRMVKVRKRWEPEGSQYIE